MVDELGNRMKSHFENVTRYYLPRRTYTICRLDGKAFHTLTRGCEKPFDNEFMKAMDKTTLGLCNSIQGVQFAYTQSDEISLLLTDFDTTFTSAWFDGNIQKIASVSASIATAHFNESDFSLLHSKHLALFDSRVFTIPDVTEVYNYFVWRQQDAIRNSIQGLGQAHFSPKELHGKSCEQIKELLEFIEVPWESQPADFSRGRFFERVVTKKDVEYIHKKTGEKRVVEGAVRHEWQKAEMPIFTNNPSWLKERIPRNE